ncbi:MAG: putative sugar O-methyltransferase [Candidatus Omnitrophica bacterium]|nr:putative sugar O-methyltransferase [Candidatus Omnitrophota bacterium]
MRSVDKMEDIKLIKTIEENLHAAKEAGIEFNPDGLGEKWESQVPQESRRFINSDFTLREDVIRNFRGQTVFIYDWPCAKPGFMTILRRLIDGNWRGRYKVLRGRLKLLKDYNCADLLKKYPSSTVGNPNLFSYKGYKYTWRWTRHIYLLWLFKQVLEKRLSSDFVSMDIGSSYGVFSNLLKKEFPKSHHVLVDFPEQLVLAHYFLGKEFPEAKIASMKEIRGAGRINREFIRKYDFVLLPWMYYEKTQPKSLDLLTNFSSFGEMSKKYFDYYLRNEPFKSTPYFFTCNRFHSHSTYKNDISVLDYPLSEFSKLHFDIFPVISERYRRHGILFYKFFPYPSQCFEFIGVRKPLEKKGEL